jgi:hypothetical protein
MDVRYCFGDGSRARRKREFSELRRMPALLATVLSDVVLGASWTRRDMKYLISSVVV